MVHSDCIDRIMALGGNDSVRRTLVDLFNAVSNDSKAQELDSGTLVIPFYDDDCSLEPGDWAAELHIVAREVKEHVNDATDEGSEES